MNKRSPGQTVVSFSVEEQLLAQIDERAESLGLNRSQYLQALARQDIASGGAITLHEKPVDYKVKPQKKNVA